MNSDCSSSEYCCTSDVCYPISRPSDFKFAGIKASDLLTSYFPTGKFKFDAKTTKDDMVFQARSSSKLGDQAIDASLESTWKQKSYSVSARVFSDSKMTLKSVCEPKKIDGSKFEFSVDYSPISGKVEPSITSTFSKKYSTSSLKIATVPSCEDSSGCVMKSCKNISADYSTLIQWKSLLFGVNLRSCPMKTLSPNSWCLKMGYVTPAVELMAVHDKIDTTFSLYKKVTPKLEMGAEAKYYQTSSKSLLTLGCAYQLNPISTFAIKADTDKRVGIAIKHKLSDHATLTLSTAMDSCCGGMQSTDQSMYKKIGIGIELKSIS